MKMNVLVTGGAGYIGSVVVSQLIEKGHKAYVLDNLSHGHKAAVSKNAELIIGEISDKKLLGNIFNNIGISAVMHFAAFIEAGESMKEPERFFRNNSISTMILLESMLENNVKKFIFSSTAAVYGDPEKIPIKENAKLSPTNAYGASKLLIEQVLSWYYKIHGLSYAALRYFNACGATGELGEDHQPETHLIPLAIKAAMFGKPELRLFGDDYPTKDGTNIRDYIHVSDLARAHIFSLGALNGEKSKQLIYNLGSQNGFSNLEVIKTVEKVLGKKVPWKQAPRRTGDPSVLIASSQKIRKELGWKPEYTNLEDIIRTAYEWKRENPQGYKI
jgi:UDP-glucose 4-epimerase